MDAPSGLGAGEERLAEAHWSFTKVVRPALPKGAGEGWALNSLDHFIAARLEKAGLQPSPAATKRKLIRRSYFDFLGLPPSPEEVDAFLADRSPDGYEKLIDRLLASPHFGERWGRHWLDVVRFAQTNGYEHDAEKPEAWRYRDWVIEAFNSDLPYDEFVRQQLAGDEFDPVSDRSITATTFYRAGPWDQEPDDKDLAQFDGLDDMLTTTCNAFLGVTLQCARCHDHPSDPFPQRDYYAMQAVFAGLQYGERRWRGPRNHEWTAQIPEVTRQLTILKNELELLRVRHHLKPPLKDIHTDSFGAIAARAIRMRIHATGNGGPASMYELEVWSVADASEERTNVALVSAGSTPSASSFALANQTRHFDNLIDGSVDQRQAFPWTAASQGPGVQYAWLGAGLVGAVAAFLGRGPGSATRFEQLASEAQTASPRARGRCWKTLEALLPLPAPLRSRLVRDLVLLLGGRDLRGATLLLLAPLSCLLLRDELNSLSSPSLLEMALHQQCPTRAFRRRPHLP